MKRLVAATIAAAALCSTMAHADQVRRYEFDRRHHTMTVTTSTLPPSVQDVPVSGNVTSETPDQRAAYCKAHYCPIEIPLDR